MKKKAERVIVKALAKTPKILKNLNFFEKFPVGLPGYPRDLPGATGKFSKIFGFFENFGFISNFSWICVVVVVAVVVVAVVVAAVVQNAGDHEKVRRRRAALQLQMVLALT